MSWEPIETAPRDGTEVLLLCPLVESEMTMGWFNEGRWCNIYNGEPFNLNCGSLLIGIRFPQFLLSTKGST